MQLFTIVVIFQNANIRIISELFHKNKPVGNNLSEDKLWVFCLSENKFCIITLLL